MSGRASNGSGSRASHEAASASSPKASIPNAADLLAAELKAAGLSTRFETGGYGWAFANAAIRAINTMRRAAVRAAAEDCRRIAYAASSGLELGPCDPTGWPETPDGGAYHQSLAIAAWITESLEHETLRSLAQGIEAQRAETLGSVHESPVAESDAPTPNQDTLDTSND